MKLPLKLFEELICKIIKVLHREDYNLHTWKGHRIFIADGTSVSMPDSKALVDEFGCSSTQREGCAFPIAKIAFSIHCGTGMISKVLINPFRSHEAQCITEIHSEFSHGDIFIADRAFCSYHHFCLILQRGLHGVIRMHPKLVANFTPGRKYNKPGEIPSALRQPKNRQVQILGVNDQIVEWFKSRSKPKAMSREEYSKLPDSIIIRQVRYSLAEKGFRSTDIIVYTTLLDASLYSANDIAYLYGLRWQIETTFNYLKTTMRMDILKSKTPDGIKKDIYTYAIAYNLVRLAMIQAAIIRKVTPQQISFIDALRWLAHGQAFQKLFRIRRLYQRPNRYDPRSRKRRPKPGYPFMLIPRPELRKKRLNPNTNALSQ